jgi:putative transcriptional regulator
VPCALQGRVVRVVAVVGVVVVAALKVLVEPRLACRVQLLRVSCACLPIPPRSMRLRADDPQRRAGHPPTPRGAVRYAQGAMRNNRLAPGLLLAAPRLGDPNFERTVVLLGRHEPDGALGWVVNGRAVMPVRELLENAGLVPAGVPLPGAAAFDLPVRVGGPVANSTGWLLYRRDPARPVAGEIDVGPELAVTGDASVLAEVIRGGAPRDFRMLLGYAGWGPGQLESEMSAGAWLPADVDAPLLLDVAHSKLWDEAYHRAIGAAPAAFTSTRRGQA